MFCLGTENSSGDMARGKAQPILLVSRITAFGASIWAGIRPAVDSFCSITRHIVVFSQSPHSGPSHPFAAIEMSLKAAVTF